MVSSRRDIALEGIENCKSATSKALALKSSNDPEVRQLAEAIHSLSFGAQQIGLAIADNGRLDDLPINRR